MTSFSDGFSSGFYKAPSSNGGFSDGFSAGFGLVSAGRFSTGLSTGFLEYGRDELMGALILSSEFPYC